MKILTKMLIWLNAKLWKTWQNVAIFFSLKYHLDNHFVTFQTKQETTHSVCSIQAIFFNKWPSDKSSCSLWKSHAQRICVLFRDTKNNYAIRKCQASVDSPVPTAADDSSYRPAWEDICRQVCLDGNSTNWRKPRISIWLICIYLF